MTGAERCPCTKDAAGWVIGTLSRAEAAAFERHLATCAECRDLAQQLRGSVELLQEASTAVPPPPQIRERLMATVRAEASLFDAAAAGEQSATPPRRKWNRPALALAAVALLAVGAVAGSALDGEDRATERPEQVQRFQGSVTDDAGGPRAKASVVMRENVAQLVLSDLAAPPDGRVYQAWVVRRRSDPRPTGTLFSVPRTGDTIVSLPKLDGVERVIVSAEPPQGSRRPTPPPVAEVLIGQ
jgi:anti-sigma-K factor RskA